MDSLSQRSENLYIKHRDLLPRVVEDPILPDLPNELWYVCSWTKSMFQLYNYTFNILNMKFNIFQTYLKT